MLESVKENARAMARAAAWNMAGLMMLLVGVSFLTVAAWAALAIVYPTHIVALIIGGGYTGLAFILFAAASMTSPRVEHEVEVKTRPAEPKTDMAQAFLTGFTAGQNTATSRRR